MTKNEVIESIAAEMDTSKANAKEALDAVLDTITEALMSGESIQFTGFGTFTVTERAARKGRNPATGKTIDIPAKNVVKFKVGAGLKDAVN